MSQTVKKGVPHKILVRNKNPGTLSSGMNTEVLLDGKHLKYVTFIKMEVKARGPSKVTLELYADLESELEVEFNKESVKDKIITIGDAHYKLVEYKTAKGNS